MIDQWYRPLLTAIEFVGILSNLPKKASNGSHHMVMDDKLETSRLSLGRLSRDIVTSSPLNLLLGTSELLHRYKNS